MILEQLARDLILPLPYIRTLIRTADHRYKSYEIPKRTGGTRVIDHPARELKLLQYWILENVLSRLPVHAAASAYRKGSNILRHVTPHLPNNFILKVDFRNFFPSISERDVSRLLSEHTNKLRDVLESEEDRAIVGRISCKGGRLTIGAPTSPTLSNAVMFDFDTHWDRRSRELKTTYSRYADDLCFSTNERDVLEGVLAEIRQDIKTRESPALLINDSKTAFTSRKRRRLITGLVLTPGRTVSLGRNRKRALKSLVFRFLQDELDDNQTESLRGLIAYASSVEPRFVESLRRKYGAPASDLFR